MQRRLTTQDVTWLLDLNGLGRLDLTPSYQRRSVWTRRDRLYFLDTIFNNYPSPAIFLHKDIDDSANATYHVVDGKQRLETILSFVSNKLPIPPNFGDERLAGKKWRDISDDPELRRRLLDYQVTVEMLDSVEPTVVNEVFGRLNRNSRKLTAQEIRHARFDGWFINRAEQEAEGAVWKDWKIATAGRYKRMQDTQFLSELMLAVVERGPVGFDQDLLDDQYAMYEYPEDLDPPFSTEEFNERFERVKSFLVELEHEASGVTSYATNLAHFYSLWTYLASLENLPDVGEFAGRYERFMRAVAAVDESPDTALHPSAQVADAARRYAENARGATTDAGPRSARHEALQIGLAEA